MELLTYIKRGEEIAGSVNNLAKYLGISDTNLSNAKARQRAMRRDACVKLAQMINEPEINVIAASELVTEKHPERRKVWLRFVQNNKPLTMPPSFT